MIELEGGKFTFYYMYEYHQKIKTKIFKEMNRNICNFMYFSHTLYLKQINKQI